MAKAESVIYSPPNERLPFLVVTLAPEGVSALPVKDRIEARTIVARATRWRLKKERPRPS